MANILLIDKLIKYFDWFDDSFVLELSYPSNLDHEHLFEIETFQNLAQLYSARVRNQIDSSPIATQHALS